MHWPKQPNQHALGEDLYLFQSPHAWTPTCLIIAHGGFQAVATLTRFHLPQGLTVRYWSGHGTDVVGCFVTAIHGSVGHSQEVAAPDRHARFTPLAPAFTQHGPDLVYDYELAPVPKGTDLDDPARFYPAISEHMAQAAALFQREYGFERCPHVVTLRKRSLRLGAALRLSEVIAAVRRHAPEVGEFHVHACRSVTGDATAPIGGLTYRDAWPM